MAISPPLPLWGLQIRDSGLILYFYFLTMPIANAGTYSREIHRNEWRIFLSTEEVWKSAGHFPAQKLGFTGLPASLLWGTVGTGDGSWWKLMNGWCEVKKCLGINKHAHRCQSSRKRCLSLSGGLQFNFVSICFHKVCMKTIFFLREGWFESMGFICFRIDVKVHTVRRQDFNSEPGTCTG